MPKTIPLQDSVHCGGKYCTNFVHRLHGETCAYCGRYLCLTCFHEKGCCKDCEDIILETDVEISRIEFEERVYAETYYKDPEGKATNYTPEELKELEEGWEAYGKLVQDTL